MVMGNKGSVNLYGGTYEKYDTAAATNTVGIGWGGGTIAVYGATINAGTASSAVHVDSTLGAASAVLNIYGGTIDGSASTDAPAVNTEAVADDATNKVTINMYGGTIKGGTRSYGGSVPLQKNVTMNMHGGTIQDGEATTSGGNVMVYTSAAFNMYDGTIKGGTVNLSSTNYLTGGGNVFAYTSAKFNMYDGTISSGNANKGGNVGATKRATLNITGGIIELGTAKAEGGNLFTSADSDTEANRVIVNLSNVIIRNGSTTAGPGGNVGVNRVSLTIGEGTQILDGTAQGSIGRAGNVRVYIGTIVMTGGTISGGTSSHADGTDEFWVQGTSSYPSVMYMLGGVIESTEADSSSLRVDASGRLYLGGNATVVDNNAANAEIYGNGPVCICDGWTGSATIRFKTAGTVGSTMSTGSLQVVTLDADRNATAGGSFTGKLKDFANGAQLACTGAADGAVTVGGLAVVDAAGNVTMTTDPLGLWATGEYAYIRLYNAYEITDPADGLWIDVNGCALTLSGSGTVNAFDTANDTYRAGACGQITNNGTVTVNSDVVAPNGKRYLALTDGTTTMHAVSLRSVCRYYHQYWHTCQWRALLSDRGYYLYRQQRRLYRRRREE